MNIDISKLREQEGEENLLKKFPLFWTNLITLIDEFPIYDEAKMETVMDFLEWTLMNSTSKTKALVFYGIELNIMNVILEKIRIQPYACSCGFEINTEIYTVRRKKAFNIGLRMLKALLVNPKVEFFYNKEGFQDDYDYQFIGFYCAPLLERTDGNLKRNGILNFVQKFKNNKDFLDDDRVRKEWKHFNTMTHLDDCCKNKDWMSGLDRSENLGRFITSCSLNFLGGLLYQKLTNREKSILSSLLLGAIN